MTETRKLRSTALYLAFGVAAIIPSALAQSNAPRPFEFQVFSFHLHKPGTMPFPTEYTPDGYKATDSISTMTMRAYNPQPWPYWNSSKLQNTPSWVTNDMYDINARVAQENIPEWQGVLWQNSDLLRSALQTSLKTSFRLQLHITTIQAPYFDLTVGRHGTKLRETVPGAVKPVPGKTSKLGEGFYIQDNGQRRFVGVSMQELAQLLTRLNPDYPVQDKTGLRGRYDFSPPWYDYQHYPNSEIERTFDRMPIKDSGLILKKGKGPAYLITIDHIERPDSN